MWVGKSTELFLHSCLLATCSWGLLANIGARALTLFRSLRLGWLLIIIIQITQCSPMLRRKDSFLRYSPEYRAYWFY